MPLTHVSGIFFKQHALPESGEKCQSSVCGVGTGESVDGETAVISNLIGKMRPEFVDRS